MCIMPIITMMAVSIIIPTDILIISCLLKEMPWRISDMRYSIQVL